MTNETLTAILANLRDDLDMLLAVNYSTDENGIAGMRERLASAVANISELATKLAQDEATLNTCVEHKMLFDKYYSPLVDENKTNISNLWVDFRTFLDDFLTYNETQSTVELSEKINLWSPYLSKLRKMLDVLDADDAQSLKNLLENGSTGGAVSKELEAQVSQNTADISELQSQVEKYLTPPDPYYTGKSFTDYPAGTIVQTYDYYEQKLSIEESSSIKLPIIYFCAEAGSSATIKIETDFFEYPQYNNTLVKVFLNDEEISSEVVEVTEANKTYLYSKTLYGISLNEANKGNTLYIALYPEGSNTSSRKVFISRMKLEVTAPNADIINKPMPFNAEHINGTYYLSDCSSGTAKIAQIASSDMHKMENLTWTDTDIQCSSYKTVAGFSKYQSNFVLDKYGYLYVDTKNQGRIIYPEQNFNCNINLSYSIDWCANNDEAPHFCCLYKSKPTAIYIVTPNSSSYATYSGNHNITFAKIVGLRFAGDYCGGNTTQYVTVTIDTNGTARINNNYSPYSSYSYDLGYFTDATVYVHDVESSSKYQITCYLKKFDKIIKKEIQFNSNTFSVLSSIEVGSYDKYFQMSNNDYFVVKYNSLQYYKLDNNS